MKRRRERAAIPNKAEPNSIMLEASGVCPGTGTEFDPSALVFHGEPPWPLSEPLPKPKTGGEGECTSKTLLCRPDNSSCAWVVGLSNPQVTWSVEASGLAGTIDVGSTGKPLMLSSSAPSFKPKKLAISLS